MLLFSITLLEDSVSKYIGTSYDLEMYPANLILKTTKLQASCHEFSPFRFHQLPQLVPKDSL